MSKTIPVVKINDHFKNVGEEAIWINSDHILKTYSGRIGGRTIAIIETKNGEMYTLLSSPEEFADLLEVEQDRFMGVDRSAVVNLNCVRGIDDDLKMVVLQDDNGTINKAAISGGQFKFVKKFLQSLKLIN